MSRHINEYVRKRIKQQKCRHHINYILIKIQTNNGNELITVYKQYLLKTSLKKINYIFIAQ